MRILVTGFEPFGGEPSNPSEAAVRRLAELGVPGAALRTLILPTCFDGALERAVAAVRAAEAEIVLGVGLAGGRAGLSLERVAVNLDDARLPDNDGAQPIDRPVVEGGPAAYFTRLPVKRMAAAIRAAGLEASLSNSAGSFVCNHLFYGLCHLAETSLPSLRAGFVHIPWSPEQAAGKNAPSLDPGAAARGLQAALAALAAGSDVADPAIAEGALA